MLGKQNVADGGVEILVVEEPLFVALLQILVADLAGNVPGQGEVTARRDAHTRGIALTVLQNNTHHREGIGQGHTLPAAVAQKPHDLLGKRGDALGIHRRNNAVTGHDTVKKPLVHHLKVGVEIISKKLVKRAVIAPLLHMGIDRGITRAGIMLGDREDARIVQTAHDGTAEAGDRIGVGAHMAHRIVGKVNDRAVHGVKTKLAELVADNAAVGIGHFLVVAGRTERAGGGELILVIPLLGIADDQDRVIGHLVDLLENIVAALGAAADPDRAEAMLADHIEYLFYLVLGKAGLNVGAKHHAKLLLVREVLKAEFFFHGKYPFC